MSYLTFCMALEWEPVPASQDSILKYMALSSNSVSYSSIKSYINFNCILHFETSLPYPLDKNWPLQNLFMGTHRLCGNICEPKLHITSTILKEIYSLFNLSNLRDMLFWGAALTGFFGMLRKINLTRSHISLAHTLPSMRGDFYKYFTKNRSISTE